MAVENAEWEQTAREWIETVGGFKLGSDSLQHELKNGIALCNFINALQPGSVQKVSKLPGPFNQMENIKAFLDAVEKYGLAKEDTFVTVDLFEGRNMKQAQEKNAPYPPLGPRESKENRRDFTKEQLEAGKHVVAMRF
ncbi:Muscle-specific 20 [Paramuricea clavata]|uniref:Muscle-specific 20 n=1 Tax=Paramuricea clavata TaxID=317549 RepID=A0A6S7GLH2_PARCT|nr:Muscle-specific 20 [Paramuricea clavata]